MTKLEKIITEIFKLKIGEKFEVYELPSNKFVGLFSYRKNESLLDEISLYNEILKKTNKTLTIEIINGNYDIKKLDVFVPRKNDEYYFINTAEQTVYKTNWEDRDIDFINFYMGNYFQYNIEDNIEELDKLIKKGRKKYEQILKENDGKNLIYTYIQKLIDERCNCFKCPNCYEIEECRITEWHCRKYKKEVFKQKACEECKRDNGVIN